MIVEGKRKEKSVKIIIATHKKYRMPTDSMYIPLHVGAEGKMDKKGRPITLGYMKDNTGDNISGLNSSFCELTGLYWAWKNLDADYIGLAHYRRHFSIRKIKISKKKNDNWDRVLTYEQLKPYLKKIRIFLPNKRRYYIETLYKHYAHTHYASHLDEMRKVIADKYPKYLLSYDKIVNQTYGYMFNMMIMENSYMNDYCTWLFDILFNIKNDSKFQEELSTYQGRYYGRLSEIAFNVWLDQKLNSGELKNEQIMELSCIHMEKINWWKKGTAFLKAKFFGKKYTGSF